jgi:hypothetical protein
LNDVKPFDDITVRCVVQARLEMGEDAQEIFGELKRCRVIDISALRLVMEQLAPARFTERPQDGLKRGTLYKYMRRNEGFGG